MSLPATVFNGKSFFVLETDNQSVVRTKVSSNSLIIIGGRMRTGRNSVMITLISGRGALGHCFQSSRGGRVVLRPRGGGVGSVVMSRYYVRNITYRVVGRLWREASR